MNKRVNFLALLLFPITWSAATAQDNRIVELKKGDRIVFFGDSLTNLDGKDNKASGILTYDGNHFNDAGMRFVAERMLERFK